MFRQSVGAPWRLLAGLRRIEHEGYGDFNRSQAPIA